jgi:hypothetical protein
VGEGLTFGYKCAGTGGVADHGFVEGQVGKEVGDAELAAVTRPVSGKSTNSNGLEADWLVLSPKRDIGKVHLTKRPAHTRIGSK